MPDRLTGGCYCGALRYEVTEKPVLKAQCHCRACQYFSGGGPNYYMLIPPEGFAYTAGVPAAFTKPDKVDAVTREFCARCGTHLITRRPGLREIVLKVGPLDNTNIFDRSRMAIFCEEKAGFHVIPDGLPAYDTLPAPRGD